MSDLRKRLIRLAHEDESLRPILLPLLKTARRHPNIDSDPEAAMEYVEDLEEETRKKVFQRVDDNDNEIDTLQKDNRSIKSAWERRDYKALEKMDILSRDNRQYIEEVRANLGW